MLDKLFSSVALGWFGRRVLDWGGWIGTVAVAALGFYNALPPSQQAVFQRAWEGNWQDITLGSIVPLLVLVFSQVMSFRATTKPAIVTEDGQKASTDRLPSAKKTMVEEVAETAIQKKAANPGPVISILKSIFGKK